MLEEVRESEQTLPYQYSVHSIDMLLPHDTVAGIYMQHFTGDSTPPLAAEKERCFADFGGIDVSLQRRSLTDMMEHFFKIGDT